MNTTLLAALALGDAALSVKKPTQNHNLMRLPSFRGIAEVRASLPGRMRLYLPARIRQPRSRRGNEAAAGSNRRGA